MISELVQSVCRQFSIIHKTGSPYNSQSQGLVERLNRTLNQVLKRRSTEEKKDWHAYLPAVQFSYNTMKQATTKETPFYLLYGYQARTPFDNTQSIPKTEMTIEFLLRQRINQQIHTLSIVRQMCIDRIELSQKSLIKRIDKKLLNRKRELKPAFKVGDIVEVFNHFTTTSWSGKLLDRWVGLFTVKRVLKKGSYVIEGLRKSGKIYQKIVHGNKLQKYVVPDVAWHPNNLYKKTNLDAQPDPFISSDVETMPLNDNIPIAGLAKDSNQSSEATSEGSNSTNAGQRLTSDDAFLMDLNTILCEAGTSKEDLHMSDSEFELQQLVQIYVQYTKEMLFLQEKHRRHTARVGDTLIRIMHLKMQPPTNKNELARYRSKRATLLKSKIWVDTSKIPAVLGPLKNYPKKRDVYEHIKLDF